MKPGPLLQIGTRARRPIPANGNGRGRLHRLEPRGGFNCCKGGIKGINASLMSKNRKMVRKSTCDHEKADRTSKCIGQESGNPHRVTLTVGKTPSFGASMSRKHFHAPWLRSFFGEVRHGKLVRGPILGFRSIHLHDVSNRVQRRGPDDLLRRQRVFPRHHSLSGQDRIST